ncbi:hypothetical protein FN846DRAFT_969759 [Sphaerosporella brunnea]|uniref:Uncharacterized protein n=1 Tax=Sphaerosporella brunnea TaxID=1250544 RepID=A0A5J5EIC2_9PEZI|nr:hypothetical protein FN846DRAFT_969759 [Sphaerosporella brunnea]
MRNAFPLGLAVLFGVMNGIYIFKPMIIEARAQRLREQGLDIGGAGHEDKVEEEIVCANERERAAKKKTASGSSST